MDISDIVGKTVGPFLVGFIFGAYGIFERVKEKIEDLEAILTKEEREKAGFADERLEAGKKEERKGKLILPFTFGGAYSLIYRLLTESTIAENLTFAIPSVYIGEIAGSVVRKLKRRGHRKDLQIARSIIGDPEHALDYIPSERKKGIEDAASEIERRILQGEELSYEETKKGEGLIMLIYNEIVRGENIYEPALLFWSVRNFKSTWETARIQRKITSFFQRTGAMVETLWNPQSHLLNIYEIEGANLRVYSTTFERFRVKANEKGGMILKGSDPIITFIGERIWHEDYKELAREMMKNSSERSTMLIKISPDLPEGSRESILTRAFVSAFAAYQRAENSGEASKN